jgi:hypothetical protein
MTPPCTDQVASQERCKRLGAQAPWGCYAAAVTAWSITSSGWAGAGAGGADPAAGAAPSGSS